MGGFPGIGGGFGMGGGFGGPFGSGRVWGVQPVRDALWRRLVGGSASGAASDPYGGMSPVRRRFGGGFNPYGGMSPFGMPASVSAGGFNPYGGMSPFGGMAASVAAGRRSLRPGVGGNWTGGWGVPTSPLGSGFNSGSIPVRRLRRHGRAASEAVWGGGGFNPYGGI